jgi:hypothetical protein
MSIPDPSQAVLQTPTQAATRVDLYDFFSVLVPGLIFIVSLYPLSSVNLNSVSNPILLLGLLLVFSYGLGRVLHAGGSVFWDVFGDSYEEKFIRVINDPSSVGMPSETVEKFLSVSRCKFPDTEFASEEDIRELTNENPPSTLYASIYSYLYLGPRTLSKTFRALFAFNRTMLFTSITLVILQLLYVGIEFANISKVTFSPRTDTLTVTYHQTSGNVWISTIAVVVLVVSIPAFKYGIKKYNKAHIKYLIIDFMILQYQEERTSSAPEQPTIDEPRLPNER